MAPSKKKSAATTSSAPFWVGLLLARDEARGLHERDVARLFARYPLGVLLAFEGGRVERALLHQIDVVGDLVRAHAAGHEDAAQHQVVDVEALLLAGGDVVPGHLVGDLG